MSKSLFETISSLINFITGAICIGNKWITGKVMMFCYSPNCIIIAGPLKSANASPNKSL